MVIILNIVHGCIWISLLSLTNAILEPPEKYSYRDAEELFLELELRHKDLYPVTIDYLNKGVSDPNRYRRRTTFFDYEGTHVLTKSTGPIPSNINGEAVLEFPLTPGAVLINPYYSAHIGTSENEDLTLSHIRNQLEQPIFPGEPDVLAAPNRLDICWRTPYTKLFQHGVMQVSGDAGTARMEVVWKGLNFYDTNEVSVTLAIVFDMVNRRCLELRETSDSTEEEYLVRYSYEGDSIIPKSTYREFKPFSKSIREYEIIRISTSDKTASQKQCYLSYYGMGEPPFGPNENAFTTYFYFVSTAIFVTSFIMLIVFLRKRAR